MVKNKTKQKTKTKTKTKTVTTVTLCFVVAVFVFLDFLNFTRQKRLLKIIGKIEEQKESGVTMLTGDQIKLLEELKQIYEQCLKTLPIDLHTKIIQTFTKWKVCS